MNSVVSPNCVLEVLEQPQDLGLHHHVERGRRLVGDEQLRVARERERDQHALALPARELVRVVARAARRHADQLQQLADARRRPRPLARRVQDDRLADLVADPLDRVERVQRALEDDRHPRPAHRAQPARLHREHVLALEQHLAGHLRPAGQQPQERRRRGSTCRSPTRRRARASRPRRARGRRRARPRAARRRSGRSRAGRGPRAAVGAAVAGWISALIRSGRCGGAGRGSPRGRGRRA